MIHGRRVFVLRKILIAILFFLVTFCACENNSDNRIEAEKTHLDEDWPFSHTIVDSSPPATYRVNDIFSGDVNGDGLVDIITTGRGAGDDAYQMVWYKNPSWKRFGIYKGDYKYGNCADIDNDGDLDIVANTFWFENLGDPEGLKWAKHPLPLKEMPDLVMIGDLNHDSWQDLVITSKHSLFVLMNNLSEKKPWQISKVAENKEKRTGGDLGDIDMDGDVDILWGNAWFANPMNTSTNIWQRNLIDSEWPSEARGVIADVNKDGKIDIVLSGEESDVGVSWYETTTNNSSGNWNKHVVVDQGYQGVHSLSVNDFDLDGDMDIFAAEMHTGQDPDKVAIFENLDATASSWKEHIISTSGSHNAKSIDLNSDGYPDIIGKNYQKGETPLRIDAWLNPKAKPSPVMALWPYHIIDENRPWKSIFIDSADINGDSLVDIITGAWWYQNPGDISKQWERHQISNRLNNMAVIYDFDGDGDKDILGTIDKLKSNQFVWAENDGGGNFTEHFSIDAGTGDFLQGARIIPLGKDGNVGVVLSWHNRSSTQLLHIPHDPTQHWELKKISSYTNGEQIAIGDLDRDGDMDIHLGRAWLMTEENSWKVINSLEIQDKNADPDRVELADINNNGLLDVIIGCEHSKRLLWGQAPANPIDKWQENVISNLILAMSLDKGDIDNDGDIDIVAGEHNVKDPEKGRVLLFINQDHGHNWKAVIIGNGMEHHDGTRFVDIDSDGDLDVISIGWTHKKVIIYENIS